MTDYVKATNFTSKDNLAAGNPLKIVRGSEIDTEFTAIQTAVASKADLASPAFTGTPTAPTAAAGTSTTQLATTAFVQAAGVPSGMIMAWPTATAPTGYLKCDGTAVSRTTYAALFAVVGTVWGAGDGSTTFNLPNGTNRMLVGAGGLYAAGATGGSKDAVSVSHTHTATSTSTVTDPGHVHLMAAGTASGSGSPYVQGVNPATASGVTENTNSSTTGITVGTTTAVSTDGVSGTNANMPPYFAAYWVIKT